MIAFDAVFSFLSSQFPLRQSSLGTVSRKRDHRMDAHVVIIGGGLAGLAAASALAERGIRATLLESRPRLGGRASSFVDRETDALIDNCQHVSMGCCTNFRHFCQSVGIDQCFREQRELFFIGHDGHVNTLSESRLPAPLHLWPALRRLSYLSAANIRSLRTGLTALVRATAPYANDQSFADWLHTHGQTPEAIERFWNVVLVSALSESLDRIDVAHARKVFVDAFFANRRGWRVNIPTIPLDELYGEPLIGWLTSRGIGVWLQSGVSRILSEGDRVQGVELRGGERLEADHFILAVPHHLVLSLLPEAIKNENNLAGIGRLTSAPISSVHLWFDRSISDLPHAVLIGRLSQWMFNRTLLQTGSRRADGPSSPVSDGYCYQVVISASRQLQNRPSEDVVAEVVAELNELWPAARQAQLLHSRLVTEHKAVFSVTPGCDDIRPVQQTPIDNLQLAGDWTRTGWPATMEGAVRSGYLACENILARVGRPERLVQPDLPTSLLSKLMLGL